MTVKKANPIPPAERYSHGAKCIQERLVDRDALARMLAEAYDYPEPTDFDYDLADKITAFFAAASQHGVVLAGFAEGKDRKAISTAIGANSRRVNEILREEGLIP